MDCKLHWHSKFYIHVILFVFSIILIYISRNFVQNHVENISICHPLSYPLRSLCVGKCIEMLCMMDTKLFQENENFKFQCWCIVRGICILGKNVIVGCLMSVNIPQTMVNWTCRFRTLITYTCTCFFYNYFYFYLWSIPLTIVLFPVWLRLNIQWIRTGSQPHWKNLYHIVLYPIFYKYKSVQLEYYIACVFGISRKTVYNTMR